MKTESSKRALAVVAGPYRFYQVLWLYTQYSEYEWSILFLPYGKGDEYIYKLHTICDKLDIFKNIYHANMVGEGSSLFEQLCWFMKMFIYFLVGKKKKLMKNVLMKQMNGNDFDVAFVGCEYSFIEGAIIGLADEKEVIIFEEGMSDYCPRRGFQVWHFNVLISYLVSKMGYFNPFSFFELKNTNLCVKYSSLPELLNYRKYKEIKRIFDKEKTKQEFYKLIQTAYPLEDILLDKYNVILFTTPMEDFVDSQEEDIEKLHQFLKKNYMGKKILIKKHPRDKSIYSWNDLNYDFLDAELPAEVFCQFVSNQEIIMLGASTVLLSLLQKESHIFIVQFNDTYDNCKKDIEAVAGWLEFNQENIVYL